MNKGSRKVVRKKEERQNKCLPEDIVFRILTRLPAKFLYSDGRNVCQQWDDLINKPSFIDGHCSRSPTGLLIQQKYSLDFSFLEINKGKSVLKRETRDFSGTVMSTCRGITLFCLSEKNFSLCVANIVTKQSIELPFAPSFPEDLRFAVIGYDYLRGEFKVICFSHYSDEAYYWLFFTVGKDEAWRKVNLVSSQISAESFIERKWISASGVIYGVHRRSHSLSIIAVNVGDESTCTVNVPDHKEEMSIGFFEEKNKLTYISHGLNEKTLSIYRLDDFRQSAWVKIHKFQINPSYYHLINESESFARVDDGDLLLFRHYSLCEIREYNLRTGSCKLLKRFPDIWPIQTFVMSKTLVRF